MSAKPRFQRDQIGASIVPVRAPVAFPEPRQPAVETAAAEAPRPPGQRRYRVVNPEGKQISWYGSMTFIQEGAIVDESGYGASGLARLREQGVRLEPVDD